MFQMKEYSEFWKRFDNSDLFRFGVGLATIFGLGGILAAVKVFLGVDEKLLYVAMGVLMFPFAYLMFCLYENLKRWIGQAVK